MKKSFKNGKIIVRGKFYEDVIYDVFANDLRVTFDGKGGIINYTASNKPSSYIRRSFLNLYINGEKLDAYSNKKVEMVGRMQKIILQKDKKKIEVLQFIPPVGNAVFYEIKTNTKEDEYDIVVDVGQAIIHFNYATNVENEYIAENSSVYMKTKNGLRFVLSYETDSKYCKKMLSKFTYYKKQVVDEYKNIVIPETAKTEKDKALYVSGIFCALENYKEMGEYKGFCAGCNYANPIRTYYRDSYWTVLAMYKQHTDLVRNQIVTLAHGIESNGDCPSSVTYQFNLHWLNHYDSPSYFIMMVYDYINHTEDYSILNELVNNKTIYDYCLLTIDKLSLYEDETGLICKLGNYNKRDWADEVNRIGYVTYDELLYDRALFCVSSITKLKDKTLSQKYYEKFINVKNAINNILWDDQKGYYINYKDGNFVEDNLSIDTIIAILFNICDKNKMERLLNNVSDILETRNNKIQRAGDFGVMCAFPFYKETNRCYNKSSQDYEYHNGAVWPYLSAVVAYAQMLHGVDFSYAHLSSFDWSINKNIYTLIEYYSPCRPVGAILQAWSSDLAWVYDWQSVNFFEENKKVFEKI